MKEIINQISNLSEFQEILTKIESTVGVFHLGLSRSVRIPVLTAIHQQEKCPILLITQKTDRMLLLSEELNQWAPGISRLYFPEPVTLFYENTAWSEGIRFDRLTTLSTLALKKIPGAPHVPSDPIIIAPSRALMIRTIPRRDFIKANREIFKTIFRTR